ncbi:MAG: isoprenoid biosynthesis glyoxalase ElbB [Bacteroidales bacterium]|nr:isoprenoid biosynthesis glyoxalase ElbB [Bacteroidales bacterium]
MEKSKKFAVVLSGCGVFDGSEIHEAVMTLYAIVKNGGSYDIFAPDIRQHHVVDHYRHQESNETRNVLAESARIARGKARPLSQFDPGKYDGLIFPGGMGAVKNLCDFVVKKSKCTVNKDVEQAIRQMASRKKPIGACCIAPVILARVLGNVKVTVGNDMSTARALEEMGATHQVTSSGEVAVDETHKVVTTSAYMLDADIAHIAVGIENVIISMMNIMD